MSSPRPTRSASETPLPGRSARWLRLAVVVVVLGAIGGAGFGAWYLFLRPSGPAAVDLANLPLASSTVAASAGTSGGSAQSPLSSGSNTSGGSGTSTGLDGTWKVDTSIGSFSDFTSSFVGYRVKEQLASVGANTAVGRTPAVSGTMTLQGTKVTAAEITADLTQLQSDDQRRDGQLHRQALETSTYPSATFKLTSPINLGSVPKEGASVHVQATGQLTVHGQTKSVQVPLDAKLSGGTIAVTGSLPIALADYGIQKPQSFLVLTVEDTATLELQLLFTKA